MSRQITSSRSGSLPTLSTLGAGAALSVLLLAGCATTPAESTESTSAAASGAATAAALTVTDPWAKATDEHMTGVFATLTNESDQPMQLVGAEAELAGMTELHETVDDGTGSTVMQEKEGGFTIEPGEELALVPGGNHVMLMQLSEEIEPGQDVVVTLEFADGSTVELEAIAKEFAGANEVYEADEDEHAGH